MAKASAVKRQDLVIQEARTPAQLQAIEGDWGAEGIDSRDIIIPKILVMQGLSRFVADGKAQMGEFRDSVSGELLGSQSKPMEFIAFMSFKTWTIYEEVQNQFKFIKTIPYDESNANWEYEAIVGGVKTRRDLSMNFYILRPEDIRSGSPFPYVVSFRRTSRQAGKKIANVAARLKMVKQPLASKVFDLTCTKIKNEKGVWFILDVNEKRQAMPEEITVARQWYDTIRGSQAHVRVDESEEHHEVATSTGHAGDEVEQF